MKTQRLVHEAFDTVRSSAAALEWSFTDDPAAKVDIGQALATSIALEGMTHLAGHVGNRAANYRYNVMLGELEQEPGSIVYCAADADAIAMPTTDFAFREEKMEPVVAISGTCIDLVLQPTDTSALVDTAAILVQKLCERTMLADAAYNTAGSLQIRPAAGEVSSGIGEIAENLDTYIGALNRTRLLDGARLASNVIGHANHQINHLSLLEGKAMGYAHGRYVPTNDRCRQLGHLFFLDNR